MKHVRARRLRLFRLCALAVALTFVVSACGGGPVGGSPGGGGPIIGGIRFDLSDAIGLQLGRVGGTNLRTLQSSSLVKLLADGSLEDAIDGGTATVSDFYNRNGRVFALLEGAPCAFVEILGDGTVSCVDPEIRAPRLRSLQFDESAAVYYRGELADGRSVIRRSLNGQTTDYYVAQDSIDIAYFMVTRDGTLLLRGETAGEFGYQQWLRAIDASGALINLPFGELVAFAPDGSLWIYTDGLRRLLFLDTIELDPRPYCSGDADARFQHGVLDFDCAEITNAVAFDAFDRLLRLDGQVIALTGEGLIRYFPTLERIPVAVDTVLTGTATERYAVLAGYAQDLEPQAFLIELATEVSVDILDGRRIEVFRARIDADAANVTLYGLDLDRNQPVLATYNIATTTLAVVDMEEPLAASFAVLDFGASHVQAAPDLTPHELHLVIDVVNEDTGEVRFELGPSDEIRWFDSFEWNLGDGTLLEGTYALASTTHIYGGPGTFSVSVTGTNFYGVTTEAIGTVTIPLDTTP